MKIGRFLGVSLLSMVLAACSASSDGRDTWKSGGTGGSGGAPSSGGTNQGGNPSPGGTGGDTQMDASVPFGGNQNGDAGPMPDGDTCSAQSVKAEPYPLDMYVMMDQSGSMTLPAGAGFTTKWQAAEKAFSDFFNGDTSGIGMGIQYFPLPVEPWSKFKDCNKTCSSGYLCVEQKCQPKCTSGSQCPGNECHTWKDDNGNVVGKSCTNNSCDASDYATPDVEIGPLPQNNQALLSSLNAHGPSSMTPTVPALQGAINHARQWAQAHTDRKVIAVLVTDGMPSVCDPEVNKVVQVAKDGANGSPPILTFVIGVVESFNPFAKGALQQIAQAGGTGQAFIVDPNQDMTGAFLQALQAIRGAVMQCEFLIPEEAAYVAYDKVNVVWHSLDNKDYTVYHVADINQCDPKMGGWYYDVPDPKKQKPTKIILCPSSCDFVQQAGGTINIEMGCQTVEMPK